MNIICCSCNKVKQIKYRDKMGLVPKVCSSVCFYRYIKKRFVPPPDNCENWSILKEKPEIEHIEKKTTFNDYKSGYEKYVKQWLNDYGIPFFYEPILFKEKYVPDFYLPYHSLFIEVKGLWEEGAKSKVNKFKKFLEEEMPDIDIIVVDRPILTMLIREVVIC